MTFQVKLIKGNFLIWVQTKSLKVLRIIPCTFNFLNFSTYIRFDKVLLKAYSKALTRVNCFVIFIVTFERSIPRDLTK